MSESSTQIPQPDVDKALPAPIPLYSAGQIAAGAFLGSFLAAGLLARKNLLLLGKRERANAVLAISAALTMLMIGLGMVLPAALPGPVLVVPQIAIAAALARKEFGEVTLRRSGWGVVGFGLAACGLVVAVLVALAFVLPERLLG